MSEEAMESYEEKATEDGFSVNGEKITLEEMEGIKFNEGTVIPPAANVRLRIKKAELRGNGRDGSPVTKKKVNILWQLVDGIDVDGEIKYKNATFFQNGAEFNQFVVWADPSVHKSDYWVERKFLKPLKELIKALGLSAFDPDNVKGDFEGKELIGSITQSDITAPKKDASGNPELTTEGKKIYIPTGEFNNFVDKMRKAESETDEAATL